jgi:Ala-tRNA(Pro) deacylase
MELYNGRPENPEGRLPREIRTYDYLDKLGPAGYRTRIPDSASGRGRISE